MSEPIQVGKYQLLDRIGTGGMAEVHLARVLGAAGFEKLVVVKRLLPALAEEEDYVTQFVDEARLAATFSHANIVSTFDFGEADGSYYIAMEYVEGKNLRRIQDVLARRGKHIPESVAIHIASEVCRGLEYAHTRRDASGNGLNVVHRDISPQNVVVSYGGDVKVLDFGIAKSNAREFRTQAGIVKGKLRYMAPEQVANEPIDGRADLFAAGVMLWELLYGKRPMPELPDTELVEWVRLGKFELPVGVPPANPELQAILDKALAIDPEQRYQTCGDFARALTRYNAIAWPEFTPVDLAKLLEEEFGQDMQRERDWIAGIIGGMPANVDVRVRRPAPSSLTAPERHSSTEAPTIATPSAGFTLSGSVSKAGVSSSLPLVQGRLGTAAMPASGATALPTEGAGAGTGSTPAQTAGSRRLGRFLAFGGMVAAAVLAFAGAQFFPMGGGTPDPTPTPVAAVSPAPTASAIPSTTPEAVASVAAATPTAPPATATPVATPTRLAQRTPVPTPVRTPVEVRTPPPTPVVVAGPPAYLSVSLKSGWGQVWINGRMVKAETPLLRYRVPAGTHQVWIVRGKTKLHSEKVTLVAGEKRTLVFD